MRDIPVSSSDQLEESINKEKVVSYLVPNEDGARISTLAPDKKMTNVLFKDATTIVEAIERGCKISENGRCVGWRSSLTEYSWLTYSEFIETSKNFGSGLMYLGANLGQDTLIGIYGKNSVEWVIAEFGCFYYCSPIVPLYDSLGAKACTFMINHGEISIIVCDNQNKVKNLLEKKEELPSLKLVICTCDFSEELKDLSRKKGVSLYLFKDILNIGQANPFPQKRPQPSDLVEVCFTSGTTGNPKGAVLTHENWISAVSALIMEMGPATIVQSDVVISYLPLAHVLQQTVELATFLVGGCVGYYSGDVDKLLEDMKVLKPTYLPAVPRLLNKLYDMAQAEVIKEKLFSANRKNTARGEGILGDKNSYEFFSENLGGNIKKIFTAAAPISDAVLKFYRQVLGCQIIEVYGQTETSGPCTANIVTDYSFGHVGAPVSCNMVKLIDVPDLGYFQKNGTGEVCVKGYNVLKMYYKDKERTAEAIDENGWLHTGDVGMWTTNGSIKIIDRIKHILKLSQGEYVSPGKLENIYLTSQFISQIFVHGDSLQSYLVAVVVPNQNVVLTWCKENLKNATWEEACKEPIVKQLILNDMQKLALESKLISFEQVKKIHLHPTPLTLEDGHLTPTLKTRRSICVKYFAKEIKSLYLE